MPNNYFQFKQFRIEQDRCAMKVGTDGVLLGAWANTEHAESIIDIGTGTGLIALMLAQCSNAAIDAVEIDPEAASQAKENVDKSPWPDRIKIYDQSFQTFALQEKKYDLIVTNPPYFENSMLTPVENRTVARHNMHLNQKELIEGVKRLMHSESRFALILPLSEFKKFDVKAGEAGFNIIRKTVIIPVPQAKPKRVLVEYAFKQKETFFNELIIEESGRHKYSAGYIALTRDYYLNMD